MAKKAKLQEPGYINSSYVVLFHAIVLCVAPAIMTVFPTELRSDALMVGLVFPVAIFWFSFTLKQFISTSLTLNVILGAAFVVAALSFLNALYGGLSGDTVPVIYTQVPFFATLAAGLSGPIGLIYAGTIMTYGAYTYIFCASAASVLEGMYGQVIEHHLPRSLRHRLRALDHAIDQKSLKWSDRFFIYNQYVGLGICVALIVVYALLYAYLLIK